MENAVWWFPGQSGLMGLNGLNIVSKQVSGSYPTRCLQYYPFDMCNCTHTTNLKFVKNSMCHLFVTQTGLERKNILF